MGGVLDSLTLVLTSSLGLASWVILMFGTTTVALAYSLYRLSSVTAECNLQSSISATGFLRVRGAD
jgi:hypothetical protein